MSTIPGNTVGPSTPTGNVIFAIGMTWNLVVGAIIARWVLKRKRLVVDGVGSFLAVVIGNIVLSTILIVPLAWVVHYR